MPSLRSLSTPVLGGVLAGLMAASAHAEFVPLAATQAPKENLFDVAPPPLNTAITAARAAFANKVAVRGGSEFEPGDTTPAALTFAYDDGSSTATFSGGAAIVAGAGADFSLGRYNMTTGLPLVNGFANPGTWFEANSDFTVTFSSAISAFSFYATDLGDYEGTVFIDLLDSAGVQLFSRQLMNSEIGPSVGQDGQPVVDNSGNNIQSANGNLLFFGITSSDPTQAFTSARFRIGQSGQGNDYVGFDSFVVGNYDGPPPTGIPEPGSLALAGLALFAAGYARQRRKAA